MFCWNVLIRFLTENFPMLCLAPSYKAWFGKNAYMCMCLHAGLDASTFPRTQKYGLGREGILSFFCFFGTFSTYLTKELGNVGFCRVVWGTVKKSLWVDSSKHTFFIPFYLTILVALSRSSYLRRFGMICFAEASLMVEEKYVPSLSLLERTHTVIHL